MVDGRVVGEVVAKSQSAKEISDLWVYVQDRLSRVMHDPKFVPEFKPADMAVGPLSALDEPDEIDEAVEEIALSAEPPPIVVTKDYQGPDRRSGEDRRDFTRPQHYGPSDKRVHAFGRRATDRAPSVVRPTLGSGLYK
jgi:hypothetical protein